VYVWVSGVVPKSRGEHREKRPRPVEIGTVDRKAAHLTINKFGTPALFRTVPAAPEGMRRATAGIHTKAHWRRYEDGGMR